ncbi:MAG: inner membrane-spanning protein YciB [Pseudomonadales bacterium]
MKQFAEFLPIAVFAGVYFYTRDIFLSTAVLILATSMQIAFEYGRTRTVSKQNLFVLASVVVLGGMTLAFRDEVFIQWKPTLVNWTFSAVLLGAMYIAKINLLEKLLGSQLHLPSHVWRNLALGWSLGFFTAGVLNLVVAFNFDMDFWVSYKLVGGFALTLFYMVVTVTYLVKGGYLEEAEAKSEEAASNQES